MVKFQSIIRMCDLFQESISSSITEEDSLELLRFLGNVE